jgi:hypothetical protein
VQLPPWVLHVPPGGVYPKRLVEQGVVVGLHITWLLVVIQLKNWLLFIGLIWEMLSKMFPSM